MRRIALLVGLLVVVCAAACKEQEDNHRITAQLDKDGYALFEVDPNTPGRAAALVEMRDAAPGTYVMLHTTKSPTSVGWFALDAVEYKACEKQPAQVDCLVPDGRGEVVGLVTISSTEMRPEPTDTTILRHELPARAPETTSAAPSPPRPSEFYAVMRVERPTGSVAAAFAFEVRQLDAVAGTIDTYTPKVKQIK